MGNNKDEEEGDKALVQHLPNGGNPPATVDDEGLLVLRDSELDEDSISCDLLPLPLAWVKF